MSSLSLNRIPLARGADTDVKHFRVRGLNTLFIAETPINSGNAEAGALITLLTAQTVRAVSTSTNDIATTGSGARTLRVHGFDANMNMIQEDLDMNGDNLTASTTQQFLRVWKVEVLTHGTSSVNTMWNTRPNEGQITVTYTGGGYVTDIYANSGVSEMGQMCVPAGYTGYITGIRLCCASGSTMSLRVSCREDVTNAIGPPFPRLYSLYRTFGMTGGQIHSFKLDEYLVIPEKSHFWAYGSTSQDTVSANVEFDFMIVAN